MTWDVMGSSVGGADLGEDVITRLGFFTDYLLQLLTSLVDNPSDNTSEADSSHERCPSWTRASVNRGREASLICVMNSAGGVL